ncbi:hypothetical protein KY290_033677 [Solanum tuberosum]|uniref:DUF4283 domain-containing protein n=1 Tax=Solanum tuberosum TaxID=4113 RepID=A0ABQ7U113_SOLTU|nr:hypothetical protein KY289_033046 [Solanum tuberosum]KAH0647691.1 hypothetical protein KY285_032939 [Solanum tuberosum]KAH0740634.1 hypothetical protein KY290_033677 [Solanum tuberosum]
MEERIEVLYSGPYIMNSRPIIVKSWAAHFDLHDEVFKAIPLWVEFPNLPLNCCSKRALSKIGSGLEVPIYADSCTTHTEELCFRNCSRVAYAKLDIAGTNEVVLNRVLLTLIYMMKFLKPSHYGSNFPIYH